MTEQPKEYIISRDQAEEYAKLYAEANTADFAKMTEVRRVANDFLKQIRSRPVSTPPEGAAPELMQTVYRCCEFYEAPTLDNPKSGCKMVQAARNEKVPPKSCFGEYKECPCDDECSVSWFCERFSVLFDYSNKISDDKVQAEREKVLNNLYRWVENANKKRFSLSELMMKIESLRHNKEQP